MPQQTMPEAAYLNLGFEGRRYGARVITGALLNAASRHPPARIAERLEKEFMVWTQVPR